MTFAIYNVVETSQYVNIFGSFIKNPNNLLDEPIDTNFVIYPLLLSIFWIYYLLVITSNLFINGIKLTKENVVGYLSIIFIIFNYIYSSYNSKQCKQWDQEKYIIMNNYKKISSMIFIISIIYIIINYSYTCNGSIDKNALIY